MGVGIHVRVHADGGGGDHAQLARDVVEVAQLLLALDIEGVNPLLQRIDDLVAGLADAGKRAVRGIATGLDDSEELAAGNDVEARTVGGQEAEHG